MSLKCTLCPIGWRSTRPLKSHRFDRTRKPVTVRSINGIYSNKSFFYCSQWILSTFIKYGIWAQAGLVSVRNMDENGFAIKKNDFWFHAEKVKVDLSINIQQIRITNHLILFNCFSIKFKLCERPRICNRHFGIVN